MDIVDGCKEIDDCYPDTDANELAEAILTIGYKEIADNYLKAVCEGEEDDWVETDMKWSVIF